MVTACPEDNTEDKDQSSFWNTDGVHWDAHRIGWVIAGATALATLIVTAISVSKHALNYRVRDEQRQIIRILYMPLVYAIISFFSYRYFRDYTYYSLIEVVYEAITLSAFLLLLIQYVAATGTGHSAEAALTRKNKKPLPIPFCCWRYRPTKPAFMYVVKWSVMQYTIVRPAISVYASVYVSAIDFVSITVALYGLLIFYGLTKEELVGKRPLAKFLCIKLIVMFTFYQSFVFSALQSHGTIHATEFWTATNVADGLNALTTCIEMVFFALGMMWAYPSSEYNNSSLPKMSAWKAITDSLNFGDFAREIYTSIRFFIDYARGKPNTHSRKKQLEHGRVDFEDAFRLQASSPDGSMPLNGHQEQYNLYPVR